MFGRTDGILFVSPCRPVIENIVDISIICNVRDFFADEFILAWTCCIDNRFTEIEVYISFVFPFGIWNSGISASWK